MPTAQQVRTAADALRVPSDPTRLKLMWALLQGEEGRTGALARRPRHRTAESEDQPPETSWS
ncbi:hypothetical protein [Glycomyces tarimensis]